MFINYIVSMLLGGHFFVRPEIFHIFIVRNVSSSHSKKMRCLKLAVDDASCFLHELGEMDEGKLRSTGSIAKHALAKKVPADVDAI